MNVVDASVAVKWFVDEKRSAAAFELLERKQGLLRVPELFVLEVAATLVRIANIDKASRENSQAALYHLLDLLDRGALTVEASPPGQIVDAAQLAIDLGHPIKDCVNLALAMKLDCPLVTADAKFAAKARERWPHIDVLAE